MAAPWNVRFTVKHPGLGGREGTVEIAVDPSLAPIGAQRFADLVDDGYFTECRFHRSVPGFIIQWGIPADPKAYAKWGDNKIKDDPVKVTNSKATLSFATSGPHARGSQIFVNLGDNEGLDDQGCAARELVRHDARHRAGGEYVSRTLLTAARSVVRSFSPFAQVTKGMEEFGAISDMGEPAQKPDQQAAKEQGNAYLGQFTKLSYIVSATRI